MKTWTDTRAYANSPWSPPFHDPRAAAGQQVGGASDLPGTGNRTLRAVASDGALFSYDNVTVSVTR